MPHPSLPPEIERHLVTVDISSNGVTFESPELKRWCIAFFHRYFVELQLDPSFYGRYYIVPYDGLDDGLYETLRPWNLPLLSVSVRAGQQNTYVLPIMPLLEQSTYAQLQELRRKDVPISEKRSRLIWYGGLSGPLPLEENARCRFVTAAPAILGKIGLEQDIKFTHLFDRAPLYRPEFGRYEPRLITPAEQLDAKYLIALDGNAWPGNLHWMLAVNSLVFRNRSAWRCILDDYFFADQDFLTFADDLSDFEQVVRFALDHESEMARIVANSTMKMRAVTRELVDEHLRATLHKIQDAGSGTPGGGEGRAEWK